MSDIEECRHPHCLILRQFWIAEVDKLLLLATVEDGVPDDAVLPWGCARDERDVSGPGDAGEGSHHALGGCTLLHQHPQRGKVGTRVVQVAGSQTIDADEHDVLDLRWALRRGRLGTQFLDRAEFRH